jgi:hypothetical protein
VKWKASGGTIAADGVFTTGDSEGRFAVHATAEGIEAVAEVQVYKDAPIRAPVPHQHVIRWSGEIPPQKRMNFYTKVLTRFVSTKELKIRVSFEVPAEGEQGAAKVSETKTGLKDLGLDDNVSVGLVTTDRGGGFFAAPSAFCRARGGEITASSIAV